MDSIEATLLEIGGQEMVDEYRNQLAKPIAKPLPHTGIDTFSIGYAMVIGAGACALDLILDNAFRQDMLDKHSEITDDAVQRELEKKVKDRLKELGLESDSGLPGMSIDWYEKLNDALGLKPPYRLRPSNHRILNHTDVRTIIEMLMKGEAGIGEMAFKIFPEMTREAATELLKLIVRAGLTGDVLQINYFSLGVMMKHLWSHGGVTRRHMDRLVDFSRQDAAAIMADFTASTGIPVRPKFTLIKGDMQMDSSLRTRLIKAGCHSTRVRVLIQNLPEPMAAIVDRYEKASKKANGVGKLEATFDTICESWYLEDIDDDQQALRQLKADLTKVEEKLA